ncbi:hypothetical protein [Mucilaginibacter sp. PPCGB 2223]|uniref:hypothetical protein n=1 Tax=Mucilaginibacter sp. PPCGB 2223 TaxID=1886027 RepID=UPI0009F1B8A0|nr:hypothetical protein [Mucilaginibacter sp. PPCGB 2223]
MKTKLFFCCFMAMLCISAAFAQRTRYSGSRHTSSHGGHYSGSRGSSHKGGHYRNSRTSNHYGRHKR